MKDDQVVHLKGYGLRDREKQLPVTPETLFPIASISKSFTATGLGMLADEKKLDWDQPVREIVAEFLLKDPVASDRDHHARPGDAPHRPSPARPDLVSLERIAVGRDQAAAAPPAEPRLPRRWQYNNLMFMAAGVVAERASGRWWEDFTRDRIFGPLGMSASRFLADHPEKADDFAHPYAEARRHSAADSVLPESRPGPRPAEWSRTPVRRWPATSGSI